MALSFDRKKKIAITGTVNCGKTVFLTSLLWQLEEHEDARFFLPRISLSGFRERRRKDRSREERFPYDRYRDALAERGPVAAKDAGLPIDTIARSTVAIGGGGHSRWNSSTFPESA